MLKTPLRVDTHVHSKYSTRPSYWILQKIGGAESYTEPLALYSIAKARGMDLITITDHNTLGGSLEIAHLENTFVSEEITTYFPVDRCKIHVLAYNITEAQHEDISHIRENIFDLVDYLNQHRIVHAVAHPMYSPNDRLTPDYFEQLFILFKNFEINGSRPQFQNRMLQKIISFLNKDHIEYLANKYGRQPIGPEPWEKTLIGGSDDHSSLTIASTFTEVEGEHTVEGFIDGLARGKTCIKGEGYSCPKTLAHNIYSIAYQFYKTKFHLHRYISRDLLFRFVECALALPEEGEENLLSRLRDFMSCKIQDYCSKSSSKNIQGMLRNGAKKIIFNNVHMTELLKKRDRTPQEMQETWFQFVNQISEKVSSQFADSVLEAISGANIFDIFHSIGSASSLYTMLAPYFISYTLFSKDLQLCRQCFERFAKEKHALEEEPLKIAHFTDTFYDVNGVAYNLQLQIEISKKNNKHLEIITCGGPEAEIPGVINFAPIGTFDLPEYGFMKLYYPPLLKMLDYCYEQGITFIHSATPGPIGLAALAIARILKLPIVSTYHTALPQYVNTLTEDTVMEEAAWKFMVWYYNQMDIVYVPSMATGDELVAKGIQPEKVKFYPRGIDIERFHPCKRNGFFRDRFGMYEGKLKLLYVGRVSKEKNLPKLIEIMSRLSTLRRDIHLVVVGDGPYLNEMKIAAQGLPIIFTGFLSGEDLAQAYASSDVFLFTSTTDTFGNVVLEAQASGIPVIVTDKGGPMENVLPNKTGFVVPSESTEGFVEAIITLSENPSLLKEMKQNARRYMENRSFEASYLELWNLYRDCLTHERELKV